MKTSVKMTIIGKLLTAARKNVRKMFLIIMGTTVGAIAFVNLTTIAVQTTIQVANKAQQLQMSHKTHYQTDGLH